MRIAMGADHAGFKLKNELKERIETMGHQVVDFGTNEEQSVDYPDYATLVGEAVSSGSVEAGVLCCGAGIGMSIAANKIPGVRAALCNDAYTARVSREHNDANVLCLGERTTGVELAWDVARVWLETPFSQERRHQLRIDKINALPSISKENHGSND